MSSITFLKIIGALVMGGILMTLAMAGVALSPNPVFHDNVILWIFVIAFFVATLVTGTIGWKP